MKFDDPLGLSAKIRMYTLVFWSLGLWSFYADSLYELIADDLNMSEDAEVQSY
jgi:hypothetical protein